MTFFVTGTDTEIGKTVAAAWLVLHLNANYWKPVQSGIEDLTDAQAIRELTGCDDDRIFPCAYELNEPLSPHESAKRDDVTIQMDRFELPASERPLVVEGAGGLMVPLNDKDFMIDLIQQLGIPSILVARSGLGTINHTLLSLEALRSRELPVAGVIMVGEKSPHNRQAIEEYGQISVLAEIPHLETLNRDSLLDIKPEPVFETLLK